ncbi:MAG: hypothetical protein RLZZ450_3090 [Pseudomonadota bacterium]|jgi:hypothetical protein
MDEASRPSVAWSRPQSSDCPRVNSDHQGGDSDPPGGNSDHQGGDSDPPGGSTFRKHAPLQAVSGLGFFLDIDIDLDLRARPCAGAPGAVRRGSRRSQTAVRGASLAATCVARLRPPHARPRPPSRRADDLRRRPVATRPCSAVSGRMDGLSASTPPSGPGRAADTPVELLHRPRARLVCRPSADLRSSGVATPQSSGVAARKSCRP